jgi:hypothetical protein
VRPKLLRSYAVGQTVLISAFFLVAPGDWLTAIWQMAIAGVALVFAVIGIRRSRPEAALVWYLVAAGVFLNSVGALMEVVFDKLIPMTTPNGADVFFMCMFPPLIFALAMLVYRRAAREDLEATLLRTAACALFTMFLGIFAWEFIIWQNGDRGLTLGRRVMVTVYPLADLIVLALMLRLFFCGAAKNVAFLLLAGSLCCFLSADVGWAIILRRGSVPTELGRVLLVVTSMSAGTLMGAALLHPALKTISPAEEGPPLRLGALGWAALAISALTAPAVLLVQALLDHFYFVASL